MQGCGQYLVIFPREIAKCVSVLANLSFLASRHIDVCSGLERVLGCLILPKITQEKLTGKLIYKIHMNKAGELRDETSNSNLSITKETHIISK